MVKMKRYSYGESRVFDCKDTRESEGFRSDLRSILRCLMNERRVEGEQVKR